MNKLVSNNFSCDSNVDVSQFLRMCGFGIYLKLISLLIKKKNVYRYYDEISSGERTVDSQEM